MICNVDVNELLQLFDPKKAVQVVKHDHQTKMTLKYLNNKNVNYPRKNWSSLILFNCDHPANQVLTPSFIQEKEGSFLHRFTWLADNLIGELPINLNWLAVEYEKNVNANLVHFNLGPPSFRNFKDCGMSELWWGTYHRLKQGMES